MPDVHQTYPSQAVGDNGFVQLIVNGMLLFSTISLELAEEEQLD